MNKKSQVSEEHQDVFTDVDIDERRAQRRAAMKRKKQQQEKIRKYVRLGTPVAVIALVVIVGSLFLRTSKASGVGDSVQNDGADGQSMAGEALGASDESLKNEAEDPGISEVFPAEQEDAADGSGDEAGGLDHAVNDTSDEASVTDGAQTGESSAVDGALAAGVFQPAGVYTAKEDSGTVYLGEEFSSEYAVLIDLGSDTILAEKNAQTRINPASMTKILTVLVAAEQIEEADLDDTFTMTIDITDYCYVNDCSAAGFEDGETITVRDLFYGTVLPSGGEAAVGLATYVAGSQEAFVELMNAKLAELGIADSAHFTNCVGLYDDNHYCTVYDMAVILKAASENALCREVLSAHTYTTKATAVHPDGILLSNWFLRRIEDKDTHGEVLCGKTGYVPQSGNCAASYALDEAGNAYICVTGNAHSAWRAIYDHVELYERFL